MPRPHDYLYDADGNRRNNRDVLEELGNVALRKALLDEAMQHVSATPAAFYPPRIFLSYKWESDELKAWVTSLADELMAVGWNLVFDRDYDQRIHRTVEEFISQLMGCGIFLAIATPAYVDNAIYPPRHDPSWVFDECQSAMLGELRLHRIALTPNGELLIREAKDQIWRISPTVAATAPFRPGHHGMGIWIEEATAPTFDEIHRMPDRNGLSQWVAKNMTFTGTAMTSADATSLSHEIKEVDHSLTLDAVNIETIDRLKGLVARYPLVSGPRLRLIDALRAVGRPFDALQVCQESVRTVDRRNQWRRLVRLEIELLQDTNNRRGAFETALSLIDRYPSDWLAHYVIGDFLDDFGELWGARNHLRFAVATTFTPAGVYNTLGVVYQKMGLLMCAKRSFQAALQNDPQEPNAGANLDMTAHLPQTHALANRLTANMTGVGCTQCDAIYPLNDDQPVICARCGITRATAGLCQACGHDGVAAFIAGLPSGWACPTCRRGSLEERSRFDL
jgi:tetratricopeptide (TPR) repeat protein